MSDRAHVESARAVYDASAATYLDFVGPEIGPRTEAAVDIAMLDEFARLLAEAPAGPVADLGCGPGRVAAYLVAREVAAFGVDPSAAMLDVARATHPDIAFEPGELTAVPAADSSLAGVVSWYSIIYTPPRLLDPAFAEITRVLRPGGLLLLGFQAGDGSPVPRADAHGTGLPLTSYRHDPDDVARRLAAAGLPVHARAGRDPELAHEATAQAFILARAG